MKVASTVFVFAIAISALCNADDSFTTKRDKAFQRVNACIRRNEVSSRECKNLNQNIAILVDVYRAGDKSVLPTLFRFTYLTDFYDEALLSDPDGFLTAMSQLSTKDQQAVAAGVAGGMFRLRTRERFDDIKLVLAKIPDSSPTKNAAQACLKTLEENNAALFLNYFPPKTFTSRAADFQIYWYSRDMYQLGDKPLWPPAAQSETTYRFTYLGAFTGPQGVTLTVLPEGTGHISMAMIRQSGDQTNVEHDAVVSQEQVSAFLKRLDQSRFWDMPTEAQQRGLDGAEWILEGTHDGKYHIVVRWCPNLYEHSSQDEAFAQAARFLLELAGQKRSCGC